MGDLFDCPFYYVGVPTIEGVLSVDDCPVFYVDVLTTLKASWCLHYKSELT